MHPAKSASIQPPPQDIGALYRVIESVDSRREFIRGQTGVLTYGDLSTAIRQLTHLLIDLKLQPGDRVILGTADDLALALLFIALLRNGLTAVVLNPDARPTELAALVEAAQPAALCVDQDFLTRLLPEHQTRWPVVNLGSASDRASRRDKSREMSRLHSVTPGLARVIGGLAGSEPAAEVDPEGVAYILFTSGTTSRPKGVEITQRSLFAQMRTFITHYGLDNSTRLLNLLPLHHTDGLTQGVMVAACAQATLLRPMRIRVNRIGEILEACHDLKATHMIAVPSMLALMVSLGEQYQDVFRTDWFRFVISTAAYLDEGLWRRFETIFGTQVINVYGLTETVCETIYCGPDQNSRRIGTIGKPVDSEARIVDDDGRPLPVGATGELIVRGPHVMRGYFRMPEETAQVLRDGWFHTGDLAQVDQDGFYRIVGRKKDVIISAGINIYPEDVNAVLRMFPGVIDAATVGLKDDQWGERAVSAVVAASNSSLTETAIAEHFLRHASPEKLPREIYFFQDLPRGPAGKVVSAELRRLIEERRSDRDSATHSGSLESRVIELAARAFKCRPDTLSMDSSSKTTPGWTSLAHVEFLVSLEAEFSFSLSPDDIMRIDTIADVIQLLLEHQDPS